MPEMRNYVVTQTRIVEVTANSSEDAVRIAVVAFEHGQNADVGIPATKAPEGIWGNTRSRVKELKISCERIM